MFRFISIESFTSLNPRRINFVDGVEVEEVYDEHLMPGVWKP